jgi:hypothetical protein
LLEDKFAVAGLVATELKARLSTKETQKSAADPWTERRF